MTPRSSCAFLAASFVTLGGAVALDGCSSSDSSGSGGNAQTGADASPATDGSATSDAGSDAAPTPQPVSFKYTPSWKGVKSVAVIGGFGQATDWSAMQAFATLADDGHGNFTGTASLPPGDYLYVFKVTGDLAGATPATFARYAIDPGNPAFAPCPMASPTFSKIDANPCSKLSVPQAAAASMYHVRGKVSLDGQAIAGYLVLLERNEAMSHHFFVDRTTTATDGTFDLAAAPGLYRLQVLHPTYLAETDAMRDPVALQALRRAISSNIPIATADVAVNGPDVGYHEYAAFAPRDAGTLPTQFTFGSDGGIPTRLTVYGTAMGGMGSDIGDPWFSGPLTTSGTSDFDGGFNTKQAAETAVKPGERYFWGIENATARVDAGVSWTGQSMVFPITWQ